MTKPIWESKSRSLSRTLKYHDEREGSEPERRERGGDARNSRGHRAKLAEVVHELSIVDAEGDRLMVQESEGRVSEEEKGREEGSREGRTRTRRVKGSRVSLEFVMILSPTTASVEVGAATKARD